MKNVLELTDEASILYEDIAKMNQKSAEESLAIILERVIRTMLYPPGENRKSEIIRIVMTKKADKPFWFICLFSREIPLACFFSIT